MGPTRRRGPRRIRSSESTRPGRESSRREEPADRAAREPGENGAARELARLHSRRLRACRSLDIPIPREAREGSPGTLLRRIALLDRRIEVSLDLAGGRHFPPWDDEDDVPAPVDDGIGETFS